MKTNAPTHRSYATVPVPCLKRVGSHLVGLVAGVGFLVSAPDARGTGFQLDEQTAKGTGRVNAVIATVRDASAVFHNPAALTEIKKTEFQVGLSAVRPRGTYVGPGYASTNPGQATVTQSTANDLILAPNAYVAHPISDKAVVGLGVYGFYGLGVKWADGDNFAIRTSAQEIELRALFFTPTVALKLSEMFSVAVGVSFVPATVYLRQTLGDENGEVLFPRSSFSQEGTLEVSGSAFGVGATVGLTVTPMERLKIGFVYRSAVDLSFSGNGNFDVPPELPAEIGANFPDQKVSADITLPHTFGIGVGWIEDRWNVELATQITLWSSIDELRINFETGRPAASSAAPKKWNTTPVIRLGGQYDLTPDVVVRAGIAFDFSPIPASTLDATLPDTNRIHASIGAGYDFGVVQIDAAYLLLALFDRTLDNSVNAPPGIFEGGFIHVWSLSVGMKI
jgi:long-chain fatty acid transport protein